MNTCKIPLRQTNRSARYTFANFLESNEYFLLPSPETEKEGPKSRRLGISFPQVSWWAVLEGQHWLVRRAIALARLDFLLVPLGSAP